MESVIVHTEDVKQRTVPLTICSILSLSTGLSTRTQFLQGMHLHKCSFFAAALLLCFVRIK